MFPKNLSQEQQDIRKNIAFNIMEQLTEDTGLPTAVITYDDASFFQNDMKRSVNRCTVKHSQLQSWKNREISN